MSSESDHPPRAPPWSTVTFRGPEETPPLNAQILTRYRLYLGLAKDFSKFDSKFACARSAQKFPRNLPVFIILFKVFTCMDQFAPLPTHYLWPEQSSPLQSLNYGLALSSQAQLKRTRAVG